MFLLSFLLISCSNHENSSDSKVTKKRQFNGPYFGPYLNKVAFPIGGIGAGMVCLEGTGCISHVSVRNQMDFFNEPYTFAVFASKVKKITLKYWKVLSRIGKNLACHVREEVPTEAVMAYHDLINPPFMARFPFGRVSLKDSEIPLDVEIVGWSPFIPGDEDNSSLPVGALEYRFKNASGKRHRGCFFL